MIGETEQRIILGAPYVFARERLAKPSHIEVVTMVLRPAKCRRGCGIFWIAGSAEEMKPDDVCPDCSTPPQAWQIGEPEEWEVAVHLAFGNLVNVDFLRSRGRVTRRNVIVKQASGPTPSTAIVRPRPAR